MLKNEEGNVVVSMVIVVMAIVSGLVFSTIANRDTVFSNYQFDAVQQMHLVRSELMRGSLAIMGMSHSLDIATLPIRKIEMDNGIARSTHVFKTRLQRNQGGDSCSRHYTHSVTSKSKTFRCPACYADYNDSRNQSPSECSALRTYTAETFASFGQLFETNESVNQDEVYFYGYDEVWGRVHSNTDIWLKNLGGWPIFHDHVSTSGEIRFFATTPDYDEVFLGGYTENAQEVVFSHKAELIRMNGIMPFGDAPSEYRDIVYVNLRGSSYEVMFGDIRDRALETFVVYTDYPPYDEVGDSLGVNVITMKDTVWTMGQYGTIPSGTSVFVFNELWLKGNVHGAQTWGCAENIYLVDDLSYWGTPIGETPDGSGLSPVNNADYLGIVSEKQILIQYGLRDVMTDGHRHKYNCPDIYIYGALCALGDGMGNARKDGVFTFQYQYPHYGTPNYTHEGVTYTYPDLHLGWFPPQNPPYWPTPQSLGPTGCPDPMGPDYPWYNPLWPETMPYKERGTIHLFGSVSQIRRGFVHRSGNDPMDSSNYWNLDEYVYGTNAWGANAPGTDGSGVGYDKDYHFDYRFMGSPPPDFPEVHRVNGNVELTEVMTSYIKTPQDL